MSFVRSFTVTVAVLVCSTIVAYQATAQVVQGRWARYTHPQFGTQLTYPYDVFQMFSQTADGVSLSGGGATLEISAKVVPGISNARQLEATVANAPGYDHVTYRTGGRTWMVVSGYRGSKIFYEKFFVVGGAVQGFSVTYPANRRGYFDPLVEHMEDTFRPGGAYF